jgi:hypothetical protein
MRKWRAKMKCKLDRSKYNKEIGMSKGAFTPHSAAQDGAQTPPLRPRPPSTTQHPFPATVQHQPTRAPTLPSKGNSSDDGLIQRHVWHRPLWQMPIRTWPTYVPRRVTNRRSSQHKPIQIHIWQWTVAASAHSLPLPCVSQSARRDGLFRERSDVTA